MVINRSLAFRAATHLATWLPFMYGAASAVRHSWRPVSDNAGIAIRAWDVLTSYGPLLGQPSRLARGVYDLGPLQYWLLTGPVHIDPRAGSLWGAAIWCMLACSLTIEAARSAGGPAAGLLASMSVLAAIVWIPGITRQPLWNPWFGLMFFLAALAAAWAVMSGHRGWWPVLMVAASVAAQAHLMYAVASGALVLVALAVALTQTIRARAGYWWLVIGAVAGLACWSAPLIQQFTSKNGNLTTILSNSNGGAGAKGGFTFGLQAVAASVQPPPVWWTSFPQIRSLAVAARPPAAAGVVALVIIAAVLVAAIRPLRSPRVAALAAISLVISLAAMYTYAAVPASNISQQSTTFNSLTYLMAPMLPLGIMAWLAIVAGAVAVARRATGRAAALAGTPAVGTATASGTATAAATETTTATQTTAATEPAAGTGTPAATGTAVSTEAAGTAAAGTRAGPVARLLQQDWALPAGALAGVAVIAVASLAGIAQNHNPQPSANDSVNYAVRVASQEIQGRLPGQPIRLNVLGGDRHYRRRLTFGLTYALDTLGYRPEVAQKYAWQLGPAFSYTDRHLPRVTVRVRYGVIGVIVRKAPANLTRRPA